MARAKIGDLIGNPRAFAFGVTENGVKVRDGDTRAIQDDDITVVSVVVQDSKGRVMLLRRSDGHKTGVWESPGGHREEGETVEEAGIREVKEETGLEVTILPGRAFFSMDHDKGHVGVMLKGIVSGGEVKLKKDEHDAGYWVDRSNLHVLDTIPTHKDYHETVKRVLGASKMTKNASETRDESRGLMRSKEKAYPYNTPSKQSKAIQDIFSQDPKPAWESLWHLSLQRKPSYDEFSVDRAVDEEGKYKGTLDDPEIDGGLDKGILPNVYKVVASLNMSDTINLTRQGRNRVVVSAENHYDLQAFSKRARKAGFVVTLQPNCRAVVSKDLLPGGLGDKCPGTKDIGQGKAVEREHSSNPEVAEEIAKDHLVENPDYYNELKKIEGSPKNDWNPNPWAVCNKSVGTRKTEKRERCIQDVKQKQAGDNAWTKCDELVGKDDQDQYRACLQDQRKTKVAADPTFTVSMDPASTLQKELQPLGTGTQVRPGAGGKVEIKTQDPQRVLEQVAPPAPGSPESVQNKPSSPGSSSGNLYYASLANVVATDLVMDLIGRSAAPRVELSPEEIEQTYQDSFKNLEGLLEDYVLLGQNQGMSLQQAFEAVWKHFLYDKQNPDTNPDFGGMSRKEIYDRFQKLWKKSGGDASPTLKGRTVGPRGSRVEAAPAAPVEAPPVPKTKPAPAPTPAPMKEPDPFDPPRPAQVPEPTNKKRFSTRKRFYV